MMNLTPDAQAILLVCSQLGAKASGAAPYTLREWNALARKVAASPLQRPGAMLDLSSQALASELSLMEAESERLARLLEGGGMLAIELERLESLGIWALTRADEDYPARLRERLKDSAPPVLFGSGEQALLGQPGLAVVGSRDVDEAGQRFAAYVGEACARNGLEVYSGAARGVDAIAMGAALESGGRAVGVLADSLTRAVRAAEIRAALERGDLALTTPYAPEAGFSVGAAMGRNRLIYALADYALVVASDAQQGGTWAGAVEALKARWVPVFVADGDGAPPGNRQLLQMGARPMPYALSDEPGQLGEWLQENGHVD